MLPELQRSITWIQGTALTIGAVLGCGILILPSVTADTAGPASLFVWVFMSFLSFLLVGTLARLVKIAPSAGGITVYVQLAFQKKAGAILGWIMLGSVPIGVPIIALTGAHYVSYITEAADWQITLIAGCMLIERHSTISKHQYNRYLCHRISACHFYCCVIATRHDSRIQAVSSAWLVCRGICFCYDFFLFCRLGNDYPIG